LAAVEAQFGLLEKLIKQVSGANEDNAEATKEAAKSQEELNESIRKLEQAAALQSSKRFTDSINEMKARIAAARLEIQGFTKDEISAAKAAGMLEKIDLSKIIISPTGTGEELAQFVYWTREVEKSSVALELNKVNKEIARLGQEVGASDLDKEFRAMFSPEVIESIRRYNINIDGVAQRFAKLKSDQAIESFRQSYRDLKRDMESTDLERFVNAQTKALQGIVSDDVLINAKEEMAFLFTSGQLIQKRNALIEEGVNINRQFAGEELRIADAMTSVQAAFDAQKISTLDYLNAIRALQGQLKMLNPIFQSIESVVQNATSTMTSALVAMFSGAEKAKDVFKNFFGGLANMILGEVMKMLIVVPIMNAIRAALGMPLVPQINPAMMQSATAGGNMYSLNQSGATMGFSQRASGGAIMAGMPTLVGERGPELFVPHSTGKIVNGNNTASLMRQSPPVVVNQTVQVTTGVQNTVRAEIQNLLPQIAEVTKAAVQQSAMRGGSYRRAFA
jgi:hypothetical protein